MTNFILRYGFFVVLCIGLYGCVDRPECDESSSYPHWTGWTNGKLVSIIDDSLAVLEIHRYEKECMYNKNSSVENILSARFGLFMVNYRVKQKPILGDTLNYDLIIPTGYIKDSSALVYDSESEKLGFWKIGEKSIKFIDGKKNLLLLGYGYVNLWINGNIKFWAGETYILDTEKEQIKKIDEEYGGLSFYSSYINGKLVCIKPYSTRPYSELVIDGVIADTVEFFLSGMLGNYLTQEDSEGKILKIDTVNFKFDKDFMLWVKDSKFYNDIKNPNDFVSYSWQDLIGASIP